ncbi:uncharacterized protein [Nicotiana sylvestris]|uniref:uncharacterized protein n=1 Tax=Nicotiana sylvestris TaxID=4096 RepID=UPI00388C4F6B
MRDSSPQTVAMRDEISSQRIYHLVDESSNVDESPSRKRRRMELGKIIVADIEPERLIAPEATSVLAPDIGSVFMADALMERRPSMAEGEHDGGEPVRIAEGGASLAAGRDRAVPVGDDDSGSDIDPEEVRAFLERNTRVEVMIEGPTRHVIIPVGYDLLANSERVVPSFAPLCAASENTALQAMSDVELSQSISGMALRTLIMGIDRDRREERRTAIFKKVTSKYREYRTKHRTLADVFNQDSEFQLFRDGLKQKDEELAKKDEELKERDDELMRAIGRCNKLEVALKAKEDELEVSKRVMAENADLQARVASLTAKLGQREAKVVDLRGELSFKIKELTRAEKGRVAAMAETTALEEALRVCRFERENELGTLALMVARLKKRIQDLEAELSGLNEQVITLKAEEARRQLQPSTSHTSTDHGVPRELYEIGEACGYDPGTLGGDKDDGTTNRLASDPWYDDEYAKGDDVA